MRSVLVVLFALAIARTASAQEWGPPPPELERLILDTGRAPVPPPEPDTYRFTIAGEHQVRYQAQRSFPLIATPSAMRRLPGLQEQSLGQNQFVSHWIRVTPRLQIMDSLELVAQVDLTGLVLGDKAHDVRADNTPRDDYNAFSNIQARWLYAEYKLPWATFRVGQQPNHWGMGIFTNDGNHPSLFGDYRYGAIVERMLFATKPGGQGSDIHLDVAGDLVFKDQLADLTNSQQALQAMVAAYFEHQDNRIGVYTTYRHQRTDRDTPTTGVTYTDDLDLLSIDLHGRFAGRVPGNPHAFLYAEAEAAYQIGSTDLVRTADQAKSQIRAYGGAAKLGVVHERGSKPAYGDLVGELEVGYASGDADPYDGTSKRFTFDPNHKVGLLLFDEIMRFATARSATAATDPALGATSRPIAGADLLPSNGGVFGAEYIYPTFIYRPREWLDLKAGMVIAQATAELVDPYRVVANGTYANYRGESPKRRDLGIEFDGGFESRFPLDTGNLVGEVGAQAGLLLPGDALDLPTQWIFIGRLGLLF